MISMTYEQFRDGSYAQDVFAQRYWEFAEPMMGQYGILETVPRAAAFLATLSVESKSREGGLSATEEGLYYTDPLRVATIFKRVFDLNKDKKISQDEVENAKKYIRNPNALGQILYGGYYGRGLIQLTWEKNYRLYMEHSGVDVISNPHLLAEPEDAFRSACWFWENNGCNEASEETGDPTKDMWAVTGLVNGSARMHLEERTDNFIHNLEQVFGGN